MNKVIGPLAATGIVVTLDEVIVGKRAPNPRIYIGLAFVALVLALLDNAAPEIAIPLAWIVLLSTLLTRGVRVFKVFT